MKGLVPCADQAVNWAPFRTSVARLSAVIWFLSLPRATQKHEQQNCSDKNRRKRRKGNRASHMVPHGAVKAEPCQTFVALPPFQDLLLRAKLLFVGAIVTAPISST
jgi:hypothetical protein